MDSRVIEELAKCDWVTQGKNLIITGQTGSGKSYLANALCISALRRFKTSRYMKASQLINDLEKTEVLGTYSETLNQIAAYELLVIDDFGLMTLDLNKCRNLFEAIDSRDPGRSTIVIDLAVPGKIMVRSVSGTHLCRCLPHQTAE